MTDQREQRAEFVAAYLRPAVHIKVQDENFGERLDISTVIEKHDDLIRIAGKAREEGLTDVVEIGECVPTLNADGQELFVHLDNATPDQLNMALLVAAAEMAALDRESVAVMERAVALTWLIEGPTTVAKEN